MTETDRLITQLERRRRVVISEIECWLEIIEKVKTLYGPGKEEPFLLKLAELKSEYGQINTSLKSLYTEVVDGMVW